MSLQSQPAAPLPALLKINPSEKGALKKIKKMKFALDIGVLLCYTVNCSKRNARVAESADAHV